MEHGKVGPSIHRLKPTTKLGLRARLRLRVHEHRRQRERFVPALRYVQNQLRAKGRTLLVKRRLGFEDPDCSLQRRDVDLADGRRDVHDVGRSLVAMHKVEKVVGSEPARRPGEGAPSRCDATCPSCYDAARHDALPRLRIFDEPTVSMGALDGNNDGDDANDKVGLCTQCFGVSAVGRPEESSNIRSSGRPIVECKDTPSPFLG